ALHRQRSTLHASFSQGEHVGIGRRGFPFGELHVLRRAWGRQRVEARRHHVEDSGGLQVVPESCAESGTQLFGFRIVGRGLEVGYREANLFDAEAGTGTNPILRGSAEGGGSEAEREEESCESFHS